MRTLILAIFLLTVTGCASLPRSLTTEQLEAWPEISKARAKTISIYDLRGRRQGDIR